MAAPVVKGENFPGGEYTITATPAQLDSHDTRGCSSITILASSTAGTVYWGYSDMLAGSKRRGFITAGGAVTIPSPVTPNSIYLYGTAGDSVFWSGIYA